MISRCNVQRKSFTEQLHLKPMRRIELYTNVCNELVEASDAQVLFKSNNYLGTWKFISDYTVIFTARQRCCGNVMLSGVSVHICWQAGGWHSTEMRSCCELKRTC